MNLETPEIRYARSGDVSIAYQVVGEGPVDLLFVPFLINLVWAWEQPLFVGFCRRLAEFSRVILLDKRGTGLSDRPRELPTMETRMDDIRAVMDAAGSDQAVLLGAADAGGQLCAFFAATYPERVVDLILHDTRPRVVSAPDYPAGDPVEQWRERVREVRARWGSSDYHRPEVRLYFPSHADEPGFEHWFINHERLAASPSAAAWFMRVLMETDIREILPTICVPTLVLYHPHLRDECLAMAERIPAAESAELTTADLSIYADPHVPEIVRRFISESSPGVRPQRVLTTMLFTDIVDSTSRAAELGDSAWRQLLQAHHAALRAQVARFAGREIRSTGDGLFATFDGPARAVQCAQAAVAAASDLGLEIRAGVHTGEVELIDSRLEGIAVHIAARVMAEASPGEVLVSSTVRDLVAGSGIHFEDRGARALRGVPGEWRMYAAATHRRRTDRIAV